MDFAHLWTMICASVVHEPHRFLSLFILSSLPFLFPLSLSFSSFLFPSPFSSFYFFFQLSSQQEFTTSGCVFATPITQPRTRRFSARCPVQDESLWLLPPPRADPSAAVLAGTRCHTPPPGGGRGQRRDRSEHWRRCLRFRAGRTAGHVGSGSGLR